MLNKNKALTNFIIGYITSILLVVLFVMLSQFDTFMGDVSGTSTSAASGITFACSFIVMALVYSLLLVLFSTPDKMKKSPIALLLTTLATSLTIAFSFAVIDLTIARVDGIVKMIILLVLFSSSILTLLFFIQEFNTKFSMSVISNNRADEWEYTNFLKLSFNKITVNHKEDHTVLRYKGKDILVIFVSEEVIERKYFLSGDMKTKTIVDLERLSTNGQRCAVVFLSNKLPIIEGENNIVSVITNDELVKFMKEGRNEIQKK